MTGKIEGYEASSSYVSQQYLDRRNILSNYLSRINFQSKAIEFDNDSTWKYNANLIEDNEQESKVLPNDKCDFCNSAPLCYIFSMDSCAQLWHMACKILKDGSKSTGSYNFELYVCLLQP